MCFPVTEKLVRITGLLSVIYVESIEHIPSVLWRGTLVSKATLAFLLGALLYSPTLSVGSPAGAGLA